MNPMHIRAKKSLGQNFLTDRHYLQRIVAAARLGPDDQVLEIGPGLGHLTVELASRARRLIIIELDDRLIPMLREQFSGQEHVEIVHADALDYAYNGLPGSWKVVANLPYYIATPLIERLLAFRSAFPSMTLMLQKEVAARIAASPGNRDYGLLSVLVQFHALARVEFTVPSGAFTPSPKVDSAVLTLTIPPAPVFSVADAVLLERVVKAAFGQRRKTLRNSLGKLGYSPSSVQEAAQVAGIDLTRRPETLSVREFCLLADALKTQLADNSGEDAVK